MIILISCAFRSHLKFFIKLVHFLMFFLRKGGPFGDDDDDDDEDHDMFFSARGKSWPQASPNVVFHW